jgi:hypothetical protein
MLRQFSDLYKKTVWSITKSTSNSVNNVYILQYITRGSNGTVVNSETFNKELDCDVTRIFSKNSYKNRRNFIEKRNMAHSF